MRAFKLIITPDPEDLEVAEVFVDGTLDGRPYRFLLDTGTARTCVQFDAYTSTFAAIEQRTNAGVFATSREDLISVPQLQVGPIVKTNFPVARMTGTRPVGKNLIGMDLLKDVCCHFLFDEQRVVVEPDGAAYGSYPLHDLFLDEGLHSYVDVQCGSVHANAVWDTGAGITIADLQFVHTYPALFQEVAPSYGTDMTGHTMETPMFIMAETIIGGNTFPPHKVAGVDLSRANTTINVPMNLILGYSTFSKAHWLFDFAGKKWGITKLLGITH